MGKFFDDYKSGVHNGNDKEAFTLIVNDLLQNNLTGADKQRTLTGYDMESVAMTRFVPSMFYVFMYNNPTKNDPSFYDRVPMILCTGFTDNTVTGINFNYLPNDVRALIIDTILESYTDFYSEKNLSGGGFKLNKKLAIGLIGGGMSMFLKALSEKTKIDISSAVRTYNTNFIIKTRMLEYDMWNYIPVLSFKDAVRGINLANAQIDIVKKGNK